MNPASDQLVSQRRLAWLLAVATCLANTALAAAADPLVLEGHTNVVSSAMFSPNGAHVVSGSWDKTVRIWNSETGKLEHVLNGHRDWVFDLAVSSDGSIISASQRTLRLWNADGNEQPFVGPSLGGAKVNALAFSSDGKSLAVGRRDGRLDLWHVGDPTPQTTFGGFKSWVSCAAIADNGKVLAAGTRTGAIRLFDLPTGKEGAAVAGYQDQQVLALAINPAGDTLASGGVDPVIRLWDLASGQEIAKLTGHRGVVTALAWSPDGKRLASGERHGQIKLWDHASSNQLITTLPGHSDKQLGFTVTCLAFSPDGGRLISGSYDKTLKIWRLPKD